MAELRDMFPLILTHPYVGYAHLFNESKQASISLVSRGLE